MRWREAPFFRILRTALRPHDIDKTCKHTMPVKIFGTQRCGHREMGYNGHDIDGIG